MFCNHTEEIDFLKRTIERLESNIEKNYYYLKNNIDNLVDLKIKELKEKEFKDLKQSMFMYIDHSKLCTTCHYSIEYKIKECKWKLNNL